MHYFLPTYLGGAFFSLLDVSDVTLDDRENSWKCYGKVI